MNLNKQIYYTTNNVKKQYIAASKNIILHNYIIVLLYYSIKILNLILSSKSLVNLSPYSLSPTISP